MCFVSSVATCMSNVLRRSRRGFPAVSLPTFLLALFVFLVASHLETPAVADTLADFQKRQLYDFEQCAGSCQVELDKRLFGCPEFKDDSDNIEALNCNAETRELYRRCLQICPADPRPDQK